MNAKSKLLDVKIILRSPPEVRMQRIISNLEDPAPLRALSSIDQASVAQKLATFAYKLVRAVEIRSDFACVHSPALSLQAMQNA